MEESPWPAVEFARPLGPHPGIRAALFDFDGTLSLVRAGWAEIMAGLFLERVPPLAGESEDDRRRLVRDGIMRNNGRPTIHQMVDLADLVGTRGGVPLDPQDYRAEFSRRLALTTDARIAGLRSGQIAPDALLVREARAFLDHLVERGIRLYLASGTEEVAVRAEAALLGIAPYFEPHIYGPRGHDAGFSKRAVIDRLLEEDGIEGRALIAFGDGPVEIAETRAVGGLAVAVASDEMTNGSGLVDDWKRERLLAVGADAVIADYRAAIPLMDFLLGRDASPGEAS